MTKLYEMLVNTDTTEGRGPLRVLAYFTNYPDAVKVMQDERFARWCVMGVQSSDDVKYYIKEKNRQDCAIYNSVDEFWHVHDTEARKTSALAKLTQEERELLGLK